MRAVLRSGGLHATSYPAPDAFTLHLLPHYTVQGSDFSDWQDYGVSAAVVSAIVFVLCCCSFCGCCIYVCRMSRRLNHRLHCCCCCLPGTPAEAWATKETLNMTRWIITVGCIVVWFVLAALIYSYNIELVESVRSVPGITDRGT